MDSAITLKGEGRIALANGVIYFISTLKLTVTKFPDFLKVSIGEKVICSVDAVSESSLLKA